MKPGPSAPLTWTTWERGAWAAYLCVWWGLYTLIPPSPDQLEYDYLGWRWLAGERLYSELYDNNWPGPVWLHALSTAVFGRHWASWRMLDGVLVASVTLLWSDVVGRAFSRWAARSVRLLYPLLYTAAGSWFAGQRDAVAAHALLVAGAYGLRGLTRPRLRDWAAVGALVGCAALIKPTFALGGPALALHSLSGDRSLRPFLRRTALIGLGALAVLGAGLAALTLDGSELSDAYTFALQINLPAYRADAAAEADLGGALLRTLGNMPWVTAGFALSLLGTGGVAARVGWPLATLCPTLWLVGLGSYLAQGSGFAYHAAPLYVFMAAHVSAAAGTLVPALRGLTAVAHRAGVAGLLCAVLLIGAKKAWATFRAPAGFALGQLSRESYLSRFPGGEPPISVDTVLQAAALARAESRPDEPVLVWSWAAGINYLAARPQPTGFFYYPLLRQLRAPLPRADELRARFIAELAARPPALALVHEPALEDPRPPPAFVHMRAWLRTHYRRDEDLDGLTVYRRRSAP